MTGAKILYPGDAAAVAAAPDRPALDGVFGEGDSTFKMVNGVIRLSVREYNQFVAKYGNTWNWCQAYGLRLKDAKQLDGNVIEVHVEEMEAHQSRGVNPDGTEIPLTPDVAPARASGGAKIVYAQ